MILLASSGAFAASEESPAGSEEWKGKPDPAQFGVGVMTGLGIVDSAAGFSILLNASNKILPEGFVPDINDSGWAELVLGPTLLKGSNAFFYSAHLRWDFIKNGSWSFYSLGGFGGYITDSTLGSNFQFFPRLAAGAFWKPNGTLHFRGEVSHELIGVGVSFPL